MLRSDFIEIERCCDKRDYEASAEICRKERNLNDPVALTWLGGLHECGVIHGASLNAALECFRAAAEHGLGGHPKPAIRGQLKTSH